jgi:hypothetical protein
MIRELSNSYINYLSFKKIRVIMRTNKIYKIKVTGTYIIIASLIILFATDLIIGESTYNNLYNNYAKVFLEVSKNIEEIDYNDLYSSDIYTYTQINDRLEKLGFNNQSNIAKVKKLSEILSKIDGKVHIGKGVRDSYKKLINAQSSLESIKSMSEKYHRTKSNYNLKQDSETLSKDCLQIRLIRDTLEDK